MTTIAEHTTGRTHHQATLALFRSAAAPDEPGAASDREDLRARGRHAIAERQSSEPRPRVGDIPLGSSE